MPIPVTGEFGSRKEKKFMSDYSDIIRESYAGYWDYLKNEILYFSWHNYFYLLIFLSVLVYTLEIIFPWRKNQPRIRKDFWQDMFYMFFNFFLFSLVVYNALSNVFVNLFNDFLGNFGVTNLVALHIESLPVWSKYILLFVIADFIQWWTHVLLHRVPALWEFHKVHHSVEQMGFAAHLRYHWFETILYKSIQYIPISMIGFGLDDFFIVHATAIAIGHLNHANFYLPLGPLKYIFNSPQMHIWHHAYEMPKEHPHGINFGLSLSIWDYLFKKAYIPHDGRDIRLGFKKIEKYPSTFLGQMLDPFRKKS